jgi:hypothetical protein
VLGNANGASTISGDLTVVANGALTQAGALSVSGATVLTAGSGNTITLTDPANSFGGGMQVISGNTGSISDSDALVLDTVAGTSAISGTLPVVEAGALVLPGTSGGPSLIGALPPEVSTAPVTPGAGPAPGGGLSVPGVEITRSGNVLTLTDTGGANATSGPGKSSAGVSQANNGETVSSSFAVIVLRAKQAPAQESSFALTQADDSLQLSPLSGTALQALTEPGKVLASYTFEITDPRLGAMNFSAEVTDTGLVIKVGSGTASELASTQRDLLVGTALLAAQRNKMATAAQVKSVFIDFR